MMTQLPSLKTLISIMQDNAWLLNVFLTVLATAFLNYAVKIIFGRLYPRLSNTKTPWDNALLRALQTPLQAFIWVLGVGFAADLVHDHGTKSSIFSAIHSLQSLSFIALFAWFLIRFTKEGETILIQEKQGKEPLDRTTVGALSKLIKASILITSTLVTLQTFGIGISGVLAFGGISGAAVAFAAKDLLANFFGGLIIYLDRPFAVGDWIRLPKYKEIEGTVEHIGWRVCRVRTFDKRPLYVPNSLFSTESIENPTRMSNRRIKTLIGVRYEDAQKIRGIVKAIEYMLKNHDAIDQNQLVMVNLVEFAPSSLNIMIYTFTKTTRWAEYQSIQEDVYLKAIDIIIDHGAQCAFPTTTLHVPEGVQWRNEAGNFKSHPGQTSLIFEE
ncbi:MAG: mechanosensitive ion channel family protein [Gammaproteobacteria bacterium]